MILDRPRDRNGFVSFVFLVNELFHLARNCICVYVEEPVELLSANACRVQRNPWADGEHTYLGQKDYRYGGTFGTMDRGYERSRLGHPAPWCRAVTSKKVWGASGRTTRE